MSQVLCIPVYCACGERSVWSADIHWLADQGLDVGECSPTPLASKLLSLPRGAVDVTGQFTMRCPGCLDRLHVLSLIRSRLGAGVGLILSPPSRAEAPPRRPARPDAPGMPAKGGRLMGRDGRRVPRARAEPDLRAQASITLDLTVLDISIMGMLAGHTHEVQPGHRYELCLRLPPGPESVRVNARVVWTMLHGMQQTRDGRRTVYRSGFEFVYLGMEAAAALEAYITRRLRRDAAR